MREGDRGGEVEGGGVRLIGMRGGGERGEEGGGEGVRREG